MTEPPEWPPVARALAINPAPREAGLADVDGMRLAWTRSGPRGTGKPSLVLVHGLTDSADTWSRVARELELSYDVVSFDARGHGSSDRSTDYLAEAHTSDLVGLTRALHVDRPVIVGHSMGGVHATLAAARMPVRAVVLEDPAWPDVPEDGSKDVDDSRRRVAGVAAMSEADRRAHGRTLHPSWDVADLELWSSAQTQLDPDVVDWFRSWSTTNAWRDHVSALHVPGLLLLGDPGAVSPRMALEARERWPLLHVELVAGAGHDIRRDRFDTFTRALTAFLDRL
ncbi:alpha/beta hydrolase [Kineococcus endophyticus]|uniref:Alpha/beta hydrolase n=1 Tax=Kineococcus endophyticus TaxID=1181883 RepID=A0ABV3PDK8_9ACTN